MQYLRNLRTSQKYFSCDEIKKEYIEPRKNESGREKYDEMIDICETGAYRVVELATFKAGVPVKSIEDFCTDQITFYDAYRNDYQSEMFYHSVSLRKNANKIMRWRIGAQFVAVVLILLFVYLRGEGG